jgi:hypothetical protein
MKFKFVLLLLLLASYGYGQAGYRVTGASVTIKGTSNLHNWESVAKEVRANATMTADGTGLSAIQSLFVEIPVKSIKSAKGSIMDGKTYDAMKADQHPNIQYKLDRIQQINKKGDGFDLNAAGQLTMSGTTQKIDLYVQGKTNGDGSLSFNGSKKLKMTDFKIKPPTALMGALTTGDEVEIVFQITMKQN